ncbi:acyltransferase [Clostridium diolis]|uniref:acyltransferase n=1 Tax=Clostridium diolis TaxID=223919 RepID=UPI003AF64B8A
MKIVKYIISYIRILILKILYMNRLEIKGGKFFFDIFTDIILYKNSRLSIGKNLYISNNCSIECKGGNITIGNGVYCNKFCKFVSYKKIKIGNDCIFGPNVYIYDHNHKYNQKSILIKDQGFEIDDVIIGNNVWVCANVVITAGSNIGNNIVIGANSVVNGELLSDGVYCGNPAKLVKKIM